MPVRHGRSGGVRERQGIEPGKLGASGLRCTSARLTGEAGLDAGGTGRPQRLLQHAHLVGGNRSQTRDLALSRSTDRALGLTGTEASFERELGQIKHGSLLEGFPEFLGYERRAAEIRLYEVGVIPGLLQTPEYATVLADSAVRRLAITADQAQERVALVAERQAALVREKPPLVFALLDESCLRRPVGGPEVMRAQMDRLIEFAEQPNTVIQVVPFAMGEDRPFSLPLYI